MRYEVEEYDPPHRILLVARTSFLTSVDEVRVEASGSGCIVTYDAMLTLNGPLVGGQEEQPGDLTETDDAARRLP